MAELVLSSFTAGPVPPPHKLHTILIRSTFVKKATEMLEGSRGQGGKRVSTNVL